MGRFTTKISTSDPINTNSNLASSSNYTPPTYTPTSSQSYLQNFFATDIRVREITQGFDILNSVNRNSLYTRYFILHSVPRFNNPTGVFDNDRYMLEIIVPEANPATPVGNSLLNSFLTAWLAACQPQVDLVSNACTYCAVVPDPVNP